MSTVLLVLVVLVTALLGYVLSRPDSFRLERSTLIQAPPETIFPLIDNFRNWNQWSPWDKVDPQMQRTYTGPDHGVGCCYAWNGNKNVGSGSMEITESQASSRILLKLDFKTPFEAHNMTEFTLVPEGSGTRVTWAMFGPQPFMAKLMGLVFNMEKMVGPQFEAGLAAMKALAEQR